MHILLGLLGVIAAFSYWFFVLRNASNAANQVIDAAGRVKGKIKRNAFRKKVEGSPLTTIEDPGTAAIVYLTKIAEARGVISEIARNEITRIAGEDMQLEQVDELVPFSEWVCQNVVNPADMLRVFKPIWLSNLNTDQRVDFLNMAEGVSMVDGTANGEQLEMIRMLRERLGLMN